MLRFNFDSNLVPANYYRAIMPDGHVIREASRNNWFAAIKDHYRRNSYELPENWKAYYEDQWCKTAPPGFCINEQGQTPNFQRGRVSLEELKAGMQTLWALTRHPNPLVPKDEAVLRAAICAACPGNVDVPGCKPCIQLANTIGDIKGKGQTPADPFLKTCFACKCSNQAQVWVKAEILQKGVNDIQLRDMAAMNPDCWKARELLQA